MKYAAISLNLDSLGAAYGFPVGYQDPTFFGVADRFFEIAREYNFKYSIYIIGRDLEKSENRARVCTWAVAGHEIGNHSWSHPIDFGVMRPDAIDEEITRAHDIITETIGRAPKGFIAPAWNSSSHALEVLSRLKYAYDTSPFPSWVMFFAIIKNLYNHLGSHNLRKLWKRNDFLALAWGPRMVYSRYNLTVLPMPTNSWRVACWHTLSFTLGWGLYEQLLRSCLREVDAFYYVVHPMDLMEINDLDLSRRIPLERIKTSLEEKRWRLARVIEIILESGRTLTTMEEMAKQYE